MSHRRIYLHAAAAVAFVALVVAVLPTEPVVVTGRAAGLLASGAFVVWYHRHVAWQETVIGQTTMAIKSAIFAVALAANMRTINSHTAADIDTVAHHAIAAGWLLVSLALAFRLALARRIQHEAGKAMPTRENQP